MKIRNILLLLASAAALSLPLNASDDSAKGTPTAPAEQQLDYIEQNGQKFVHVSTISTVAANTQFMQNMQLVNQQRQALVALNKHKEESFTDEEKKATDEKLKELSESLKKNSEEMVKAYGYSIARDYIPVFTKTRIYRKLADAEYVEKQKDTANAGKLLVKENDKFFLIHVIETAKDNILFQNSVGMLQRQNTQYEKVAEVLKNMPDSEDKKKLASENAELGNILGKNKEEIAKLYGGFDLAHSYLMEVEESKLYVKVTEEEFLKAQEQQKENALKAEASALVGDAKAAE